MPLTLKIISKQRHILGADSISVFSVHGGSIGRAPDNDWVLPDPDRYISGHHAAIDYRAGAYYLRDNSTNGVFVNHSERAGRARRAHPAVRRRRAAHGRLRVRGQHRQRQPGRRR
jgi:type VI secretion system protein